MTYEIASATRTNEVQDLLREGWEPFAVTREFDNTNRVWVKRKTA